MSGERNGQIGRDTWLIHLIWKLLHHDEVRLSLLEASPLRIHRLKNKSKGLSISIWSGQLVGT